MIYYLILVIAILICAFRAMRAALLINVTIWLAGTSALTAVLIYMLGAPAVAVIELSVGAGLVTVLFVFSFSITGEITTDERTLLPRGLVWVMVIALVGLLSWLLLPLRGETILQIRTGLPAVSEPDFGAMLWQQRGLDVLVQMVLIFAGVMGLLGLLSTSGPGLQILSRERGTGASELDLPDLVETEVPEAIGADGDRPEEVKV
jgi:uncharacterized MnhB-related membrane protein